jgi:hypothetical protein
MAAGVPEIEQGKLSLTVSSPFFPPHYCADLQQEDFHDLGSVDKRAAAVRCNAGFDMKKWLQKLKRRQSPIRKTTIALCGVGSTYFESQS